MFDKLSSLQNGGYIGFTPKFDITNYENITEVKRSQLILSSLI